MMPTSILAAAMNSLLLGDNKSINIHISSNIHRPLPADITLNNSNNNTSSCSSISNLFASRADLTTKEFQLEELEDREECETELWLNDDGTVTLGETNGPLVQRYQGDWHVLETASENDKPFRMRLTRTYEASSRYVSSQ